MPHYNSRYSSSSRARAGKHSGNIGMVLAIPLVAVLIFIVASGTFIHNQACANNLVVVTPAVDISAQISNYPTINGSDCSSLLSMISLGNNVIANMNSELQTTFTQSNINLTCDEAIQYAPAIGDYNQVILSARQVDSNNATSVTQFYENLFQLAADYFIINAAIDTAGFKIAWSGTGVLNDGLKLEKISSLCGDVCYSALLSNIHYFIRDHFDSIAGNYLGWAESYMQTKSC